MTGPANAALFGTDFGFPGELYSVDTGTGTATSVASTGNNDIGDLTSDTRPGSSTLRGVDLSTNELLTLDHTTGSVTSTVAITGSNKLITSIAA